MMVGFGLQSLLESLSCPFAAFGFHFHLNLPQCSRARLFSIHPFPFVEVLVLVGRLTVHTTIMGAVSRCALRAVFPFWAKCVQRKAILEAMPAALWLTLPPVAVAESDEPLLLTV
jgi:hypothetical protein